MEIDFTNLDELFEDLDSYILTDEEKTNFNDGEYVDGYSIDFPVIVDSEFVDKPYHINLCCFYNDENDELVICNFAVHHDLQGNGLSKIFFSKLRDLTDENNLTISVNDYSSKNKTFWNNMLDSGYIDNIY